MLDILSMENLSRRQRHFGLSVDYILLPLLLIGFIDLPQTDCQIQSAPSIGYSGFNLSPLTCAPGTRVTCFPSVNGNPKPTTNFYKDGQLYETANEELNKPAEVSDAGYWWIVANNSLGAVISNKLKLSVYYFNNTWNESAADESKHVETRDAVLLEMPPIDTYPELSASLVKWYHGTSGLTNEVSSDSTSYITKSFGLVILDTQSWYNGRNFQVEFTDKFGTQTRVRSGIYQLVVSDTSRSTVAPSFVIPLPGTSEVVEQPGGRTQHVLECVVNASPLADAVVKWYKMPTGTNTRQDITPNSDNRRRRLNILSPITGDRYICEATMPNQPSITSTTTIQVIEKPTFSSRMNPNTLADIGTSVSLPCQTTVSGTKIWFKNAVIIRASERLLLSQNGSLTLSNVGLEDTAVYQCMVENEAGSDIDRTYLQLNSAPPTIPLKPENLTVITGVDASLTCGVEGKPDPTVKWTFRPAFSGAVTEVGTSSSLVITRALWTDSGTYTCNATNTLGSAHASATLTVYNVTTIIPQQYPIEEQKSAAITRACRLSKDSRVSADISWFRTTDQGTLQIQSEPDNRVIDEDNQVLRFISLRSLLDEGQFTCRVVSPAGNRTASYNITIVEVPFGPRVTATLSDQPRTINLAWTAPFNGNRPILNYRVRSREFNKGLDWNIIGNNILSDARSHEARNLKPAKTYEFVVTAVNSVGEGQWSPATDPVRIAPEAPSAPPTIESLLPLTQRSVRVRFSPPPRDHWNSDSLRGYIIEYRPSPQTSDPNDPITYNTSSTGGILTKDIENLQPFSEYWVRLAAFNEVEGSQLTYSQLQKVTTREGVPQSPPVITQVTATSSTQCRVVFQAPDSRLIYGVIKGYYVRAYLKDSQVEAAFTQVDASLDETQNAILNALRKYTEYRLTVSLFTDGGESPIATSNCTTQQDIPEAVMNLDIPDKNRTYISLNVTWNPPTVANGILLYYKVAIRGPGKELTESYNITHPFTYYVIYGLASDSEYTVMVQAATVKGLGPSRQIIRSTRPPPVAPQPATNLAVTNIEGRSALIRFNAGDDGDALVKKWIVEKRERLSANFTWLVNITDPGSERTILPLENLLSPYTNYSFQIFAVNIAGPSLPSEPTAFITTKTAAPEGPPKNITMRPQNHATLIINWEPLEMSEFNGGAPEYIVQYQSEYESSPRNVSEKNPLSRFFVLRNLTAYSSYTVRVLSKNSRYESVLSAPVSAKTIEYVPSRGPASITVLTKTSDSVDISWPEVPARHSNGIILGYKVMYQRTDVNELPKTITVSAQALGSQIGGLEGYTQYAIQVSAFTRVGDGEKSPVKQVYTSTDVPSSPQSFSMKNIMPSSMMLTWRPPLHPNSPTSEIKYSLSYGRSGSIGDGIVVTDLTHTYYSVDGLVSGSQYTFELKAGNSDGDGEAVTISYTVSPPATQDKPGPPQNFFIQSTASREITLRWNRGMINNLPILNYTLSYRKDGGVYENSDVYISGLLERYVVKGLTPATKYFFKLQAANARGLSEDSTERSDFTSPEKPSAAPASFEVVPKTATSLNISWSAPPRDQWNGQLTHTRIWYAIYNPGESRDISSFQYNDVDHPLTNSMLDQLIAGNMYEIRLGSVNSEGVSNSSNPIIIYVGVAVPVGAPSSIEDGTKSDTEITISWNPVSTDQANGQLLGYKVYYQIVGDSKLRRRRATDEPQYDLVGPEATSHTLTNLQTFKQYMISVTAYNIAGEGPPSPFVIVVTDQGLPGPIANLTVTEVTLTLVNVTWDPPASPNGNITEYEVKFYSADDASGVSTTRSVAHSKMFVELKVEEENMAYNFTIQAVTVKGAGEPATVTYKSGPHTGVPKKPDEAEYSIEENGVMVKWTPSSQDPNPVMGYVIEGLDDAWQFVMRSKDPDATKVMIPNGILPESGYIRFQVSLFNQRGLGEPKEADKVVKFYSTWWFLVIIALGALLIIITVTAVLCCYCFRMRAKMAEEAYEQDVIGVDSDYNTYEMRQSFKRENQRRGSKYRAEPPRPSPGAVLYSDEAPPRYDDNSSVTEKGDLTSDEDDDDDDTKGKMSGTDSSDDDIDKTGASSVTPSYNNYQYGGGYNHYVQSGAVQQSWQNSFGRSRNPRNMYSYTDSEAESSIAPSTSHYRASNGRSNGRSHGRSNGLGMHTHTSSSRQHLVDSPDGSASRAPLPNFSSFV